jgi:hypothetical protein
MSKQIKLEASKHNMQRSSSQSKICISDDEFYAPYSEFELKIDYQDIQRVYHIKIYEPTRMQHTTIDSTYRKIYQRTYLHSEMLDPKENLIFFAGITNNKNDNHPT